MVWNTVASLSWWNSGVFQKTGHSFPRCCCRSVSSLLARLSLVGRLRPPSANVLCVTAGLLLKTCCVSTNQFKGRMAVKKKKNPIKKLFLLEYDCFSPSVFIWLGDSAFLTLLFFWVIIILGVGRVLIYSLRSQSVNEFIQGRIVQMANTVPFVPGWAGAEKKARCCPPRRASRWAAVTGPGRFI